MLRCRRQKTLSVPSEWDLSADTGSWQTRLEEATDNSMGGHPDDDEVAYFGVEKR